MSLQVICERNTNESDFDEMISKGSTGSSFMFIGEVVASIGTQKIELNAHKIVILGEASEDYPLAKKKHSLNYLREILHLRPRTRTFGAMARVRHALAFATHDFFNSRGFLYCNTPLLTSSDCEGAGEMFQVTTLLQNSKDDVSKIPTNPETSNANYNADFFKRPTFLAVSGQLNVEAYACSLSNVYTFGPTFRAERAKTTRHLAEFWMIEPEIAFADLKEDMDVAEDYIKYTINYVLNNCRDDLAFFENLEIENQKEALAASVKMQAEANKSAKLAKKNQKSKILEDKIEDESQDKTKDSQKSQDLEKNNVKYDPALHFIEWNTQRKLRDRLNDTVSAPFQRISYTAAIEILQNSGVLFSENPVWGIDLPSEMERYLAEVVFKKPTILYDYPKDIKAFYMRSNEDGKTVAAMDILVPGIGELVGGSQREERLDVLEGRMLSAKLDPKEYKWYLDLRKFGTVPHSGFGLGFERLVRYCTGLQNIKDTCMFPRAFSTPLEG